MVANVAAASGGDLHLRHCRLGGMHLPSKSNDLRHWVEFNALSILSLITLPIKSKRVELDHHHKRDYLTTLSFTGYTENHLELM